MTMRVYATPPENPQGETRITIEVPTAGIFTMPLSGAKLIRDGIDRVVRSEKRKMEDG